ncbi:cytochrome P450 [Hypoxylon cercidicola]|nr:cytochrome P450 [Hypoxylon cercidicola]
MPIPSLLHDVAFYAAGLLATYLMIRTEYRLLLHPLKNYLGPQLAKISDTYSTYHSVRKSLHLATRQAHLQYGPVIRLGPNNLVFNTVEALHDIYDNDRVDKARTYLVSLFTPYPNIFNVIDKDKHRIKRKLIGRLISESSMRKFEPIMLEQVDIFVQQLLAMSRGSAPINMSDRSKYIGADISPSLAMLRLEPIAQLINLMQKKSYLRLWQEMIKSRLKEEKHAKYDLYSHLADYVDSPDDESLSLSEIWSEALFFFPAGGETVTTGIAALFFYLSRSPTSYERLKMEIRSAFTSGAEIKGGPQLAGCQYLRACIDETLRMSPPVPGTLWREQSLGDKGSEPLVVDGHVVPRGVIVGVNIYALHHNEEYFPDPFAFKPGRWLASETPAAQRQAMNRAFAAFQVGPRGRAGKAMAYLEFGLVVAKTLWYFDLELPPGELAKVGARVPSTRYPAGDGRREEYQLQDVFTTDHDGPYLMVRPRDGASKDLETR